VKQVVIAQSKHVDQIIEAFETNKEAPNPALIKLLGDDLNSLTLEDQANHISQCAMLMLYREHCLFVQDCGLGSMFKTLRTGTQLPNRRIGTFYTYLYPQLARLGLLGVGFLWFLIKAKVKNLE
jgi:hypothetical protein